MLLFSVIKLPQFTDDIQFIAGSLLWTFPKLPNEIRNVIMTAICLLRLYTDLWYVITSLQVNNSDFFNCGCALMVSMKSNRIDPARSTVVWRCLYWQCFRWNLPPPQNLSGFTQLETISPCPTPPFVLPFSIVTLVSFSHGMCAGCQSIYGC